MADRKWQGTRLSVVVPVLCEGILGHSTYRQRGRIERARSGARERPCRWCGRFLTRTRRPW